MRQVIAVADYIGDDGEPEPFAAMVVRDGEIIGRACGGCNFPGVHAEIVAMQHAVEKLGATDLSDCTLYSNFEPCMMCATVARDFGIGRVVYAVRSPYWGGESRSGILSMDLGSDGACGHCRPPEIVGGVLEAEGRAIFDRLGWVFHKESVSRET